MNEQLAAKLADYPVVTPFPVQWSDMDMARHVNNVIYLRWAETGRVSYLDELGLAERIGGDLTPVVAKLEVKYRFPVTYPDLMLIGTRVTRIDGNRFWMENALVSEKKADVACRVTSELVLFNTITQKKADMPVWLMDAILAQEGWAGGGQ
jgi:acyl-CoA thioester hydrolase